MRVLERNKNKETPTFSRAIEKLIRYFSKSFPENCGVEGNLKNLNMSSHGQSTASNFYRSSTFNSDFSELGEELRELNMMTQSEGKQGNYNINFNFIDSKTSNDSNSLKDATGGNEYKTELLSGIIQRKMSNEKSPSSNNISNRGGYDSSYKQRENNLNAPLSMSN